MKHSRFLGLAGALAIIAVSGWVFWGYPSSISEAIFNWRMSKLSSSRNEVSLAELMPGDWEQVCYSHGYSGPFYLEKYGKSYGPVGRADDDAWGLIFIAPDGSSTSAQGSCAENRVRVRTKTSCLWRTDAVLKKIDSDRDACPAYALQARG